MDTSIREARPADLPAVAELLANAGLVPIEDSAQFGSQYAVAQSANGTIVGVAGYERYGSDILLRSVAVSPEHRSAGIGSKLASDRLANAKAKGCTAAYLLTDSAQQYWERRGFVRIDRSAAPEAITHTREWRHACPAAATAMFRGL